MSQLLHMEVPNFGSTVLDSLNEQRLLGQHCDVAIMVNGQAFKAHRAVLAASSLYFRDLFSGTAQTLFELPSSVTPSCFQQILSFCYTGKMTVAASDQLMVMYTAGYLQIQNIVERGMDLMFKASAPFCDSQTSANDDPPSPIQLLGDQPVASCEIKQEKLETPVCSQSEELKQAEMEAKSVRNSIARSSALFYTGIGANGTLLSVHPYDLSSAEHSSPGASSIPATDSPTSHQNEDEDLEEDSFDGIANGKRIYGYSTSPYAIQDKMEFSSIPVSLESRFCVLLGGDREALPASLISQIGYRCHPALYTEGDPGERLELIAGSGVFMTRGQLMNCHLCAGIKHKVLLRRLLAAFFDRNTLADSCGTGIRSSNCDPSRKPLDSRILNTVKLYCQNFAPNFKESEMNVIAADMCTNARRVRKRWLPKIKSMLPEGVEVYRSSVVVGHSEGGAQAGVVFPFDSDLKHLASSDLYAECREALRTHPHFAVEAKTAAEEEQLKAADDAEEAKGRGENPERTAGVLTIHSSGKKGEVPTSSTPPKAHHPEQNGEDQ
ncbi:nucleus accumbens-associated protein 2 [Denticeps clupeoides]|uniref:Nucleus accumbens-associated protein 2 n=1 Tax=Denticeps clupeoides TaxID=299321 RepID=A0AAY4EXS2_9TELE|nr:nucleus accumbens-associated protein 2-like [Denticeps clupeoides]XP_028852132.1 nucleus accumbens-associated protein 2-like [Denticeps clupeoides]